MKTRNLALPISVLIFLCTFFVSTPSSAIHAVKDATKVENYNCTSSVFAPLELYELKDMSRKEVEKKLNKKLKFKERMVLKIVKKALKKADKYNLDMERNDCAELESKANTSFILGIIGMVVLPLIMGIIALSFATKALRIADANPDCPDVEKYRAKAQTGKILGIIAIALSVVLVLAVAAVVLLTI